MTAPIDHEPWIGEHYSKSMWGKKVVLMGYSHYVDGEDHERITKDVVSRVNSASKRLRFFTSIARAFGEQPGGFFDHVIFLNYVASSIGESSEKRAYHDEADEASYLARIERLVEAYEPDVILVFSAKAWGALTARDRTPSLLWSEGKYWVQECVICGCRVVGTCHPERASRKVLEAAARLATS